MSEEKYVKSKVYACAITSQGPVMVLLSKDDRMMQMNNFSPEIANYIEMFKSDNRGNKYTWCGMFAELIDNTTGMELKEIKIYPKGDILRANLYFEGREKSLILSDYRASESIALAMYYDAPIKVREDLLHNPEDLMGNETQE